ncbi:MAG: DNA-binding protein WhiA [Synergistaceae bacterium]|nr:DNA-binding protein WhiA [Synergistaceae bacterium]
MKQIEHILWDEWLRLPFVSPVEDEIAGIISGLTFKPEGKYYKFSCNRLFTIRRLLHLLAASKYQNKSSGSHEIIQICNTQQRGKIIFNIKASIANEIIIRSTKFGRRVRNWNWIRGVWGSCGSLYLPKTGYYLVVRLPECNNSPERLQGILKSVGFTVSVRKKLKTRELILRNQQHIVTFLSRLGFVQTTLALEETAIFRMMRSHANKLVNCDSANINKSLAAAQNQLLVIKKLESYGLIESLSDSLKELIDVRKTNPSASLSELGQKLSRPISKSTVKYRWKKLEEILKK